MSKCVYVFLHLLHTECQNIYINREVTTFLGSKDIFTGPHSFKGLLQGKYITWLGLELDSGFVKGLVVMIRIRVRLGLGLG